VDDFPALVDHVADITRKRPFLLGHPCPCRCRLDLGSAHARVDARVDARDRGEA
jgi:hypothetical protein